MQGVLLTDSLMNGCPDDAIERLKVNQGLKELDVQSFPGYTTEKLIGGNGEIHSLMLKKAYDRVFLVCGANDFNHNNDDCHVMKCKSIAKECEDLLHTICNQFPTDKR